VHLTHVVRRQKSSPVQEQVSSAQMRHLAGVTHSADLVHTAVGHSADLVHAQDGITVRMQPRVG